jgi:putative SOS response-associated peptidase YedK
MLVFQQGGSGFAFRVRVHIGNLASFPLRREARPKTEGMSVSCDSCLVRFPYKPAARPMPRQESAIISFICGRYRLSRRKQLVEEYFGTVSGDAEWNPLYNILPSQPVITIRQDAREPVRKFSTMRWGLVPSWAKDPSIGCRTINARAETVATTASFRDPFKSQRCLIPADGFYEWKRNGTTKQPYCFEVNDGELFAFAGLWDRWMTSQGEVIESCTILTTTPNALLADVHDRMPVILSPDNYDLWLDPDYRDLSAASETLRPFDPALMRRYPVSTRVNQVQNDDAECAKPVEPEESQVQRQLF